MQNSSITIPIRWWTGDIKELRKKYKAGQQIEIERSEIECDGPGAGRKKVLRKETYEVIATYPYHVLCQNEKGTRQSFGYFELEQCIVKEERPVGRRMWWNKGA